ncbi:MAG: endonuclease/exonuclease/phosphatase family protein [Bacteroidota bacterium]
MRLLLLLLLAAPLAAQDIPAVGTEQTLDVATWNIERFGDAGGPSDAGQFANALAVIRAAEIDLWALQEMNDEDDFEALVDSLGDGWEGEWRRGGPLGYGFIYKTDIISPLLDLVILDEFSFAFASRPPLLLLANVTLPDTTVRGLHFIDIHAKCCSDQPSYNRRLDASGALKDYLDEEILADGDKAIILGDLNDELRSSITPGEVSPYQNFRDDGDNYRFLTEVLDLANVPTFCSNQSCTSGSTLDHILLTREVESDYQDRSLSRFDEVLEEIPNYTSTTSDHVPVYARFDFAPVVSTENETAPTAFALRAPFPNPFREATTLAYDLPAAATVQLEVFDALGRRVATLGQGPRSAGTHEVTFAPVRLVPGLYLVRLTADGQTATRRLVHAR